MAESTRPRDHGELIRHNVEALNRRDYDALLSTFRPDAVWEAPDLPDIRGYRGRDAIRVLFEEWVGVYEEFEHTLRDLREFPGGVTFTEEFQRGRLSGSRHFVENHYALVTVWKDRLVERVTTYQDVAEARLAAEQLADEGR